MYKIVTDTWFDGSVHTSIVRVSDGAVIPPDEANTDYAAYKRYIEDGGQVIEQKNGAENA